jgi:predicted transcriptional regulator
MIITMKIYWHIFVVMFETSEQRVKLLKEGFSGKEIERLYIEYNSIKIVYLPILYEISEFHRLNMKTSKDEEMADALISLGMSRNTALTLAYMQNANSATSIELERSARLRQPEVSMVMRQLKERDWVNEREAKKKTGKGRPNKIYSLKVGFNDIIGQLEKQQKKAVDEMQEKIKRLKDLGK